ncbi:MAG: transposase [Octadecabacter sp.]|jgi:transposase
MLDDVGGGGMRKKNARRSAAERAAIVVESFELGAAVSGVARRHEIVAAQLSGWRCAARAKASDADDCVQFAEVAVSSSGFGAPPVPHDGVEIAVGSVVIRLPKDTAARRIVDIAQRLASQP